MKGIDVRKGASGMYGNGRQGCTERGVRDVRKRASGTSDDVPIFGLKIHSVSNEGRKSA